MEIRLPYGKGERLLRIPEGTHVDFLRARDLPPLENLPEAFAAACSQPVGGAPLGDMARPATSVVILVSDITRSRGMEVVLPLCIAHLEQLGVKLRSIKIIIARGTHRKLTKEEKAFFRRGPLANVVFEQHDCDDADRLSALLLTRRGTPVRVNLALKDAGLTIILAPISFHYFAGFGGGRKLVLPGCADRQSILANHRLSLVDGKHVRLHPSCRPGVLEGNPVHEDMCETVAALKRVFSINFFADTDGNIVFLNAGDVLRSHQGACRAYKETHSCPIAAPYDVVVLSAGGYPYDINFLQSHKPLRHISPAVKRGGAVLYYAECEEGIGSPRLEAALKQKKEDFLKTAYKQYDLNNQTAVSLYDLTDRHEIGVVSALNVDLLLACGIAPRVNAESFLAEAIERRGADRVALVERGHGILPEIHAGGGA
jgi:nickel-dependent lactate racemase